MDTRTYTHRRALICEESAQARAVGKVRRIIEHEKKFSDAIGPSHLGALL